MEKIYFKEEKQILTDIVDIWNSQKSEETKKLFTKQMLNCILDIGIKKTSKYDIELLKSQIEKLEDMVIFRDNIIVKAKADNTILKNQLKTYIIG